VAFLQFRVKSLSQARKAVSKNSQHMVRILSHIVPVTTDCSFIVVSLDSCSYNVLIICRLVVATA